MSGLTVGAIGPATTQALEAMGIIPDFVPEDHTNQGIAAALKQRKVARQQFLLPRADIADKELAQAITALGASVDDIAVYRTVPATAAIARARTMLLEGKIDVVTFTSSSTVSSLVDAFSGKPIELKGAKVACIGPKTAETAVKAGLKVDIMSKEQTIPGLVGALEDYFKKEA